MRTLVLFLPVVLCLLLVSACVTIDELPPQVSRGPAQDDTVRVTPLPDGRLLLSFEVCTPGSGLHGLTTKPRD